MLQPRNTPFKGQAFLSSQYPGLMSLAVVNIKVLARPIGTQQSAPAL